MTASNPPPGPGGEPSMEDILASIRRILSEEEAPPSPRPEEDAHHAAPEDQHHRPPSPDVLILDQSMLVPEESDPQTGAPHQEPFAVAESLRPPSAPPVVVSPLEVPEPPPAEAAPAVPMAAPPSVLLVPAEAEPPREPVLRASLLGTDAAAAAATSVGSLVRTLTERSAQVRPGGPTIEEIVREEMRPLLKQWLDANLPSLVERHVRAEIVRVVGRVAP